LEIVGCRLSDGGIVVYYESGDVLHAVDDTPYSEAKAIFKRVAERHVGGPGVLANALDGALGRLDKFGEPVVIQHGGARLWMVKAYRLDPYDGPFPVPLAVGRDWRMGVPTIVSNVYRARDFARALNPAAGDGLAWRKFHAQRGRATTIEIVLRRSQGQDLIVALTAIEEAVIRASKLRRSARRGEPASV
jgi:hypothetical protein